MKNRKGKRVLIVWSIVIAMFIGSITPSAASAEENVVQKTTVNVEENGLEVSGTNSFGKLIAELLDGEIKGSSNYYISDLEIEEKQAKVSYSVSENCSLVVAVYDEQGIQMLGSGMQSITAAKSEATVDIDVEDLPQYFLVKAFLLDSEKNTALSQVYTCDHYTKEFQEFLSKTTDDFEKEKILNLDADTTTNFAVFNNETTHIEGEKESNRMVSADLGKNKYVIADADEKTKALQAGEIFYYTNDAYDIMVKIKAIQIDGDTVTITAEEAELDEIFSYIKIEANTGEAELTMDNYDLAEGVSYIGSQADEPDFFGNRNFSAKKKAAIEGNVHYSKDWHMYELNPKVVQSAGNVSASISGKIRLAVSYRGDIDVYLDSNRFEIDFTIKPAIKLNLSVKGSVDLDVPLGKGVAISPMPGVYITFDPRFKASLSAEVSANIKGEFVLGMGYDTNQGLVNKSQEPTLTADYDMNASVYIGLSLEPKAKILSDYLASAWLKIDAGAKVEVSASDSTKRDNKKQHDCTNCLEGSIHFLGSLSAGADVNLLLKEYHPSMVLWKPDFKVADFYYSATYNEGGLTTCPHIRYLTTVNVVDKLGRDFSGIKVYWDNGEQSITDKSGDAKTYLANGTHTALVKNPNNANDTKTKEFEVKDKSSTVQLKANWSRGNLVNIKVVDIHGNVAPNVTVYCSAYTDGNVTDEDGMAYFAVQNGTYDFYIADADGNRITKSATLKEADENLTLQTTWNCSYLVTLNIQDKNGKAVAGAKVTYGDKKVTADENGKAEIWVANGKHTFYIRDAEENMVLPTVKEVSVKDADVSETVTLGDDIEGIHGNSVDGGTCGNGVKWKLYEGGVLYIYGQGKVESCEWRGYKEQIIKVIISNGVQNIYFGSFRDCGNLESVIISDGLSSIGICAFENCNALTSIELPDSLSSIGEAAFRNCNALTSIELPDSLSSIGEAAFRNCNTLTSIELPDSLSSIGEAAFGNCNALTSIELPDSLSSIGGYAFSGCSSLKSVGLPDGLTSIKDGAFSGCSSLKSVKLPTGLRSIEGYAFYRCSNLKNLKLPNKVNDIGEMAFFECKNLTNIEWSNELKSIGGGAFAECDNLTSIKLPDGLTSIEDAVNDQIYYKPFCFGAFDNCDALTSVKLPNSLNNIGERAFGGCVSLTSVELSSNLNSIGNYAFSSCVSLTSVELPNNLNSIGDYAFSTCSGLTSIGQLPISLTSIGNFAFFNCYNLATNIELPNGLTSVGNGVFRGCRSLTNIGFTVGLISIGNHAFDGCWGLTSIELPNGLKSIGDYAFSSCVNLTSVEIPDSLSSMGNYTFECCYDLARIKLPRGVSSIGEHVFDSCRNLIEIDFPDGLDSIGDYAFYDCPRLVGVDIPSRLRSIGEGTFAGCFVLTRIDLPDTLSSIGDGAFAGCPKLTIYAPSGTYAEAYANQYNIPFISINSSKKAKIKNKRILVDNMKTIEKQDAVFGQDYILLVLRDSNAENLFSADNLLYIDQAAANGNGIVHYNYLSKEEADNAEVMILGPSNYDLSALEKVLVNCENGLYTKESQEFAKEDLRTALRLALRWTFVESQKEIDILARRLNDFLDEVEEESTNSPTPDVGDSAATSSPSPGNTASPVPGGTSSPNPTNAPSQSTKPDETAVPTATPPVNPGTASSSRPVEVPVLIPTISPGIIPTKKPDAQVTSTPEPSVVPTVMPTEVPTDMPVPSVQPSSSPDTGNSNNTNPAKKLKKGTKVGDSKTKAVYKVTGTGKNRTVEYDESTKKNAASITVPATVKLQGKTYKVTSIKNGAFKDNKKLRNVKIGKNVKTIGKSAFSGCSKLTYATIGKNVKKIGAKAFYQCKNLRYILVKTKKLTLSSIGKKAFSGGYCSPRVKTDKSIWKRYSGIFIQRGMSGKTLFVIDPVKLVI